MSFRIKFAIFCYGFNAVGLFLFGLIYTFSSQFLPFHSDAIQQSWDSLNHSEQVLYLGMMRTEGAGMLSSAIAIAILLAVPFKRRESWCLWAMTSIGIIEHLPSLVGAYNTSQATPASSPWYLNMLGILLLIIGLILAHRSFKELKNN